MHLIMEYAENGSLDAYIHTSGLVLKFENLLNLMRQCVKGLAYLHGRDPIIMHRDVKPANMVLTSNYRKLKICDFGLVKSVASTNTVNIGSAVYTAPEIYNTKKYDEMCDVYSFGVMFWEVMSQRKPFENCTFEHLMNQVLIQKERPDINAVKNSEISEQIKEIIELCWQENSDARPSMKALEDKLNTYLSHFKLEKGLAYLHGSEPIIMHRDVKPANMVLTSNYRKLKICDFGLVKSIASKNTENIGSAAYTAPEIYKVSIQVC
ncbi:mitogen-activated protein kinase kinase kinase 7 [Drosophila busckii]|uniref:mitogen-activated protein kinase kinase kinase 7 n=1 Tax=Drosophila busckii TaxID=30019 RepID=UPI0014328381|nr:mitogen-activated protein kinase kinase kinase 7 [Drosophila busckii]